MFSRHPQEFFCALAIGRTPPAGTTAAAATTNLRATNRKQKMQASLTIPSIGGSILRGDDFISVHP